MKAAEHLHRYCTASMAAGRDSKAQLRGNFSSTVFFTPSRLLLSVFTAYLFYI